MIYYKTDKFERIQHLSQIIKLLTETTGFTFRFKETKDVTFTDGSFNVTDDTAILIFTLADHFNTNLGDTTTRTGTTKALGDTSIFNLFFILEIFNSIK